MEVMMAGRVRLCLGIAFLAALAAASGGCGSKGGDDVAGPENTIEVVIAGTGGGRVRCTYGGIDCPGSCGPVDWTPGGVAPFVAEPDSSSTFAGWSGAATGTADTCSVVVTGHMVLTATFDPR
jgi:uncharacterized repeat protein (TIGR02543 family)